MLAAVVRDLRRHYSKVYSVLQASSGEIALDALKRLVLRSGETVALFLSDQRMPSMSGVAFLEEARNISGCPPRAANRVHGYGSGHSGDQRGKRPLLPAEALGPR